MMSTLSPGGPTCAEHGARSRVQELLSGWPAGREAAQRYPGVETFTDGGWVKLWAVVKVADRPWPPRAAEVAVPLAEDLARMTMELGGQVKWSLGGASGLRLQAEWPVEAFADSAVVVEALDQGCRAGLARFAADLVPGEAGAASIARAEVPATTTIQALSAESGWEASRRGDGSLSVVLDVSGRPCVATLVGLPGELAIRVSLLNLAGCGPESRRALALLALRVNACLLWVRSGWLKVEDGEAVGLEVRLPVVPGGALVGVALGALSVACRRVGREVAALADKSVAAQFTGIAMEAQINQVSNNQGISL